MPIPMTWTGLRGDYERRGWYRLSDLIEAAAGVGAAFTEWDVRKAVRGFPRPVKRYGNYQYGEAHRQAVIQAAKSSLDRLEATGLPLASSQGE